MASDRHMSRSMRIALENWERAQPAVLRMQRAIDSMPDPAVLERAIGSMPEPKVVEELTRTARTMPDPKVVELLTHAARTMPDPKIIEQLTSAARTMPDPKVIEQLTHAARTMPDPKIIEQLTSAARTMPDPKVIEQLTHAARTMPDPKIIEQAIGSMSDLRKVRRLVASAYDAHEWQQAMAHYAGAGDLHSVLANLSDEGDPPEMSDSPSNAQVDDGDSELDEADRLRVFLILLRVLPRIAANLDAEVVANFLRWMVEVALEFSSGA